jgi:hypothetical protein
LRSFKQSISKWLTTITINTIVVIIPLLALRLSALEANHVLLQETLLCSIIATSTVAAFLRPTDLIVTKIDLIVLIIVAFVALKKY